MVFWKLGLYSYYKLLEDKKKYFTLVILLI